jgi:hypothetical protein
MSVWLGSGAARGWLGLGLDWVWIGNLFSVLSVQGWTGLGHDKIMDNLVQTLPQPVGVVSYMVPILG